MAEVARNARNIPTPLMPVLRYRDCDAAMRLLTEVLGFTAGTVFRDDAGKVVHAELFFGNGGIMIGPVADTPFGKFMRQPAEAGGVTAALFCVVADPDAHHAAAKAAGLEILLPLTDQDYGSREYSVRDPDGHIWTFGTYEPQRP